MSRSHPPSAEELGKFLKVAGVCIDSISSLSGFIKNAIACFEKRTGWRPFLASNSFEKRCFKAPKCLSFGHFSSIPLLEFDGGLAVFRSICSRGRLSSEYLLSESDFLLMPLDAPKRGRPYEWIEFSKQSISGADFIEIDGRWGYSESFPDDVWHCILKLAAISVVIMDGHAFSGGVKSWSEEGVKEEYSDAPFGSLIKLWKDEVDQTMGHYLRFKIGI